MNLRFVERDGKKILQEEVRDECAKEFRTFWRDVPLVREPEPPKRKARRYSVGHTLAGKAFCVGFIEDGILVFKGAEAPVDVITAREELPGELVVTREMFMAAYGDTRQEGVEATWRELQRLAKGRQ